MDDMKKLVEKYKRELMEYSKAAAPGKLEFPEMLPETAPSESPEADEQIAESSENAVKTPAIIAWSADQSAADGLEKYFSDLKRTSPQKDDFTTLPPQFTEDAPQYDFTDSKALPENNNITGETEPEQPAQFRREGENTTADPEQFDSIGTVPQSGTSPDEQLGRRSFESRQTPVNSPDDIRPLVQQENSGYPPHPTEPEYADLDEFLKANPMQGSLRFSTYTARNALPVPNARIIVTKVIGGSRHSFYDLTTDASGQTQEVALPAPPSSLSQSPNIKIQPYSVYDADITAEGYIPVSVRNLPVFEGILSVQRAALVPSDGNDRTEIINETEPDLTEVSDA